MSRLWMALVVALAAAGCNKTLNEGYAVAVTVKANADVTDAMLQQVRRLDVDVSGAEAFTTSYPISDQLAGREARFLYKPAAQSGALTFAVAAVDGSGTTLATGMASVTLVAGATMTLTVPLSKFDLSQCTNPCPTLGATRCMGTQVQTCAMVAGCQTWNTASDCGANMLCCNDACVAADASNCYACGAACGGQTPACLPQPMKCGCSPAVCATSNQGCDPATGGCVACPALAANSTDFYVDATGLAAGTGTVICPFKTIGEAIVAANNSIATNKVIHVAAGTYANEKFPLTLRGGISLVGAGAASTVISGTGTFDHSTLGGTFNAANYNLTILTGATSGTSTISNLTITSGLTAPQPNYFGILCDRGNAPDTRTQPPPANMPAPTTVLSGVTVGPNYDWSILAGTSTSPTASGCNLKMVGSTLTGNRLGVWAAGCGVGTGASSVAVALGDGTKAGGNSFLNLQTGTATGVAVLQYDCVSPLTIDYATFDGCDAGASFLNHSGPAGGDANLTQPNLLQIRNSTFQNLLAAGVLAYNGAVIDQLIGNTFTKISAPTGSSSKNAPAIWLASLNAQIIKARNNVVVGNDIGLLIDGNALSSPGRPTIDFGNANDPGNNTLACNSSLAATGGDVIVNVGSTAALPINLQGNKWDHTPPTTATTQSNGLDLFYSSTSYVNTANASAAGVTCPSGRIP